MNRKLFLRIFVSFLAICAVILLYFSRTPTLLTEILSYGFAGIVGILFVASVCFWGYYRFINKGVRTHLPLVAIVALIGGIATCAALYTYTPLYVEFSLAKDEFVTVSATSREAGGSCEETTDTVGSYHISEICPGHESDVMQFRLDRKTGFLDAPGGRQQAENFFRGRATIVSLGDSWFYYYQPF